MRSIIAAATVVLVTAACHEPEQPPPAPPPTPTNPTIDSTGAHTLAFGGTATIDASIVSDGGSDSDARVFLLDTGVVTFNAR